MPSIRSRIAREFVRLNVTLSGFNHYPYRFQRLVFSRAIPLISLKVPGVAHIRGPQRASSPYIQTGTVEVLKDDAGRLAAKAR